MDLATCSPSAENFTNTLIFLAGRSIAILPNLLRVSAYSFFSCPPTSPSWQDMAPPVYFQPSNHAINKTYRQHFNYFRRDPQDKFNRPSKHVNHPLITLQLYPILSPVFTSLPSFSNLYCTFHCSSLSTLPPFPFLFELFNCKHVTSEPIIHQYRSTSFLPFTFRKSLLLKLYILLLLFPSTQATILFRHNSVLHLSEPSSVPRDRLFLLIAVSDSACFKRPMRARFLQNLLPGLPLQCSDERLSFDESFPVSALTSIPSPWYCD